MHLHTSRGWTEQPIQKAAETPPPPPPPQPVQFRPNPPASFSPAALRSFDLGPISSASGYTAVVYLGGAAPTMARARNPIPLEQDPIPDTFFPQLYSGSLIWHWAYWSCSLLFALQKGFQATLQAVSDCWRPGGVLTVRNGPDQYVPQWATVDFPGASVVLFRGTSNVAQAVDYFLKAFYVQPAGFLGKVNGAFWASGVALWQELQQLYPGNRTPLFLAGHSYGAAVAACVAHLAASAGQPLTGLCQFGSPLAGSESFNGGVTVPVCSIRDYGDPITGLPPITGTAGALTYYAGLYAGSIQQYAPLGNGWGLSTTGDFSVCPGAAVDADDLASWFVGLPTDFLDRINAHYLNEYIARFERNPVLRGSWWRRGFADGARIAQLNAF